MVVKQTEDAAEGSLKREERVMTSQPESETVASTSVVADVSA